MTQLTFFGPESTPFIISLAYHLASLEHCVLVLYVGPDHAQIPTDAAHLTGIRLGQLHVRPENFEQTVQAVSNAGFGHALVIWSGPLPLPVLLALNRKLVDTQHLDLQELGAMLAQHIEQARLAGTGPLALTVTDVPQIH
ncbi:hypothetical protein [Deinococcus sp. AJ005]|uniref:hypothetical protein n=1 Tax=Deinococcus sp. AJ005 TaxID=2652443 RepID=UPI00125CAA2A|nr:hypothetical protein [Deinococcus sp. AJ005]QFP77468.1 hypothetical protein DAAJ005_14105 [Deinococcus sp. AJ005]